MKPIEAPNRNIVFPDKFEHIPEYIHKSLQAHTFDFMSGFLIEFKFRLFYDVLRLPAKCNIERIRKQQAKEILVFILISILLLINAIYVLVTHS